MKILITGVNGFLGKALVKELKKDGFNILGTSIEEKFLGEEDIVYIQANLSEEKFTRYFKNESEIDAIIHCGAHINYNNHDLNIIKSNCLGMYNIVELCVEKSIKKIIFISSIQVIGEIKYTPIDEKHDLSPQTLYHSSKIFGENYLLNLLNNQRIILRLTSPVGVGMPDNKVMKVFVKKCIKNEEITLLGEGKRVQNYIDIRDVVRSIKKAIHSDIKFGVFNLGGKKSISNYNLASLCKNITKSNSKIVFSEIEDREEKNKWIVDISKIKEELGFEPIFSLEQTIKSLEEEIIRDENIIYK